jgi:hypothetical protein
MRSALGHHADRYSLLRQGETCWRTAAATRATLLVDSEQYFGALRRSLGHLVRTRPGLQIHVARWDYHWLYSADREADTSEQLESRGVRFYEYSDHPLTACVHPKIVVIDERVAASARVTSRTKQRRSLCKG